MNRFDNMSKDAMARVEEIMNSTKLNEFLHRKEEEEKKKTCILWILAIIGVVAAVAAIAYGVYRFFTPDYLEDFEDDFDDDYIWMANGSSSRMPFRGRRSGLW